MKQLTVMEFLLCTPFISTTLFMMPSENISKMRDAHPTTSTVKMKMEKPFFRKYLGQKNVEVFKALIEHPKLDLEILEYSYLHIAMEQEDSGMMKLLLRGNFKFESDDKPPLAHGCLGDNVEPVKMFLDDKRCTSEVVNQKWGYTWEESALIHAIKEGNLEMVRILMTHKDLDFNTSTEIGITPIMFVMAREIIEYHKERKSTDNAMAKILLASPTIKLDTVVYGKTCLHYAAKEYDNKESVKAFIDHNNCTSDLINRVSKDGKTALELAVEAKNTEIVKILSEHEMTDCNLGNPMKNAVENNYVEGVKCLINKISVKFEFPATFRNSGLIKACANNHVEVVKLLLDDDRLNADILSIKNGIGETALMTAVIYGNDEIAAEIVRRHGQQDELKNKNGENAFDLALKYRPKIAALMKDMRNQN